nr:hypothetical protein Iba_chr14eCG1890 [Ipomoea batatas]
MVHGLIRRSCLAGKKQEADDGDVNREDERLVFLFAMQNEKPVKEEADAAASILVLAVFSGRVLDDNLGVFRGNICF